MGNSLNVLKKVVAAPTGNYILTIGEFVDVYAFKVYYKPMLVLMKSSLAHWRNSVTRHMNWMKVYSLGSFKPTLKFFTPSRTIHTVVQGFSEVCWSTRITKFKFTARNQGHQLGHFFNLIQYHTFSIQVTLQQYSVMGTKCCTQK